MNIQVNPVRRNLKFRLPKSEALSWNPAGLHITQFYNTLSIFFPAGERFFIQSVRHFRDQIESPELQEQIAAFIKQEGFHTREHLDYNDALIQANLPVESLERLVAQLLNKAQEIMPAEMQLAGTVSLEHLTALLGATLLQDDALLEGAEPHFSAIWRWHAIEETEHKAVCFDAYEAAVGSGPRAYTMRVGSFLLANLIFWSLYFPFLFAMLARSGGLGDLRGWGKLGNFVFGKPGILRRILPQWLDFFRPDFHPWMHDNRDVLAQAEELMRQVESFQPQAA